MRYALLFWSALFSFHSLDAQSFDKSYAVLIAINDYQHPGRWPHLDYPETDARALAALLSSQGFIVKPFYGSGARKEVVLSYLTDKLAPTLGTNDRVLIFFAGHGHTENLGGKRRGYIVPYDGDANSTLISMDELQDESSILGNARHQFFLLDSCFGGLLERGRDSTVSTSMPNYIKEVSERVARQALTAGGENDQVVDNGPNGHSVFMDALLEALKDGRADLNGDGFITFSELVAYMVPRASNRFQTPAPGYLPGHQLGEFLFQSPKGPSRPVEPILIPAAPRVRSGPTALTAEQHIAAGDAIWPTRDWYAAAAEYREAIGKDPNSAIAHFDLGLALGYEENWDGEIKELQEALRLRPDFPEAYLALGTAFAWKGNWDGEIKEEQEVLRLRPDFPDAHQRLGMAFGMKGNWDGEIKEEQEALRLRPDFPDAHQELGIAFGMKGNWDGEIKEEQAAVRLRPDYPEAHQALGVAFSQKGNWDEEIKEEEEALRLRPDYPEAHEGLGVAFGTKGNWDGAIKEEQEALRLRPNFPEARQELSFALARKRPSR